MKINRRSTACAVAFALILIIFAQAAFAAYWPGISPEDSKKFMSVSEVKRGMRGYGLTVFHGTTIEKFDVEVLGVLKKMNTGRDLILVRVGGGPITSRQTGIMSGMSGSPIYINGKLVGAISYGASFSKEPVGMVTPIADMLEAWDPNLPKRASGYSSPELLEQPVTISGKSVTKVGIDPMDSHVRDIDGGTLYMQPLMMNMMVSGMSQRGIDRLAGVLKPFNIRPIAGPGGASDPKAKASAQLQPGAAVGMSLASGDIDLTGIGTVTYRSGDKIVAFGHPMLGIGAVDAPMTTAYIADVISSYQVSTKLGASIATVGRIFQDRPWCIAGAMGAVPKMIPVTINVNDQAFKRDRVYNVKVINHPMLAPQLIAMVTDEAMYEMHPTPGDATAEVGYEISADQIGKIKRSNVFFDPISIGTQATMDVASLLQILSSNKFSPLDVKSVNVNVKIIGKRNTATIDRIFVKKSEFEPGETVDVGVVLRPYKQDRVTKTFKIKIPATAADGKIALVVRGGATPTGLRMATAASAAGTPDPSSEDDMAASIMMMPGDPGMANADNVKQLVAKYLERERNNEIVLQLQMRGTAINIAGEKLAGMPSAISDIMKSSRNSGLKTEREEVKAIYPNDSIINGTARLMIDVKKKRLGETKSAPKSSSVSDSLDISVDSLTSSSSSDSSGMDLMDYGDYSVSPKSTDSPDIDTPSSDDDESVSEDSMTVEKDSFGEPIDSTSTSDTVGSDEKAPAPSSASKSNVKTVVRQAQTWTQKNQADFAKGTFAGVSASTENKLELAPTLSKLKETPEQYVWCVASTKGGVYAGTGNSGKIYKISDSGESSVFYETGELEVHSIVRDSAGNVYAGTSPHGKIFKISPDGKGTLLYAAPERYVLALALDSESNVYAGVGDAGKVYRIPANGGIPTIYADINEQQILSLSWDAHGSLLIGTGINGVVYRAAQSGSAKPIFDAAEDSITSVAADGDGNAYAGTSPKGAIYKIFPDGRSKTIYPKANRVLSMVSDSHNNIYAVSDNTLVKIAPDETVTQIDSSKDKAQFLSLALNEESDRLYAGTGNIGSVYVSKCCDASGTYESPVHDAKMTSKWGRIKWVADVAEGASVELRTRTGNVETPDATWTNWSEPYTKSSGESITSEPGRYVQYQVTLSAGKAQVSPKVAAVTLSYLNPNQAPTVKITKPAGGEVWSGKQTIKWTGVDPDKDKLSYDVFCSNDGGKNWTALVGGITGGAAGAEKKPASEITKKIDSELAKSKDIPEDMKAKIVSGKDGVNGDKSNESTKPAGSSSTSTSYTWDTSKADDGTYVIKVAASDKASNANDSLSDDIISEPFVVCNKAPDIKLGRKSIVMKGAASATITGVASSKLVEIAGVQYRVDGGEWAAASSDSGMFDSPSEEFTITTSSLSTGSHKVEVQAIDAAGNASDQTVEVKVS